MKRFFSEFISNEILGHYNGKEIVSIYNNFLKEFLFYQFSTEYHNNTVRLLNTLKWRYRMDFII